MKTESLVFVDSAQEELIQRCTAMFQKLGLPIPENRQFDLLDALEEIVDRITRNEGK